MDEVKIILEEAEIGMNRYINSKKFSIKHSICNSDKIKIVIKWNKLK